MRLDVTEGVTLFSGLLDRAAQEALRYDLRRLVAEAPFYTPEMPRTGKPFSVRMTNLGGARLGFRPSRRLSLSGDAPGNRETLAADPGATH